ncbi:coagulation factor VIII isoform X1 [Rhincodon typus]|uniref:coagulation factor VIII isoform X1 n=2 Tax=Rhincodon typus TaxID=259920 RepID=UPI00202E1E07|nr:coagulation factor VIII isoform X1 [Rhincodon typus]
MRALAFCVFLVLLLIKDSSATVRKHYIAAVEFNWDYRNSDLLLGLGAGNVRSFYSSRTIPQYRKAIFVEFKDSSFLTPEPRPKWMGILGPTIRAEVNDKVIIHFKNLASRPFSIHPFGISYWKMSEGASYNDHTSMPEKKDDIVPPKGEYMYVWEITDNLGPMNGDSDCLTYAYSSYVDPVRDFNSGLIGAMLVCRQGSLNEFGKQMDRQEFVLLFSIIDESKSMYLETDRIRYRLPGRQNLKGRMYSINGYTNVSLPDLNICKNKVVSWHLIAMGSTPELYSIYFGGYGLLLRDHRVVSVELAPAAFVTAEMIPSYESKWLLSSQNPKHQQAGMKAYVNIKGICEEDNASILETKQVEEETDSNYYEFEDEEDNHIQINYLPRTTVTKSRSMEWIYYIAAVECKWDYAPTLPDNVNSELRRKFLERGPDRIGKEYKKAVYVEYTDSTFTVVKHKPNAESSKGILGPVLRGEVGDRFKIIFKNLASRPYNINPHGLTEIRVDTTEGYNVRNHIVPPNKTVTYFWSVTENDGPTNSDPGCLTRFYFSNVDMDRDIASGLIGPLLICAKNMLDINARMVKIDKAKYLFFSIFDENKSWYIEDNIEKYCEDPSRVNPNDPNFYDSNLMYSINGFVYENVPKLKFCEDDVIFWHVIVGAQDNFLSIYFHGQTFKHDGVYEDVLTLFPLSSETIHMHMDNIGLWFLEPLNYHYQVQGMRANFRVRNCDNDPETLEEFLKEIDPDEAYGNILQEETEELIFKPRTFNAHNNNITKLYEAIELEELMNITNDVENMTEKDPIWSHCRPRPNRISHKQYTDGKKENDFLYHANHLSKDSKKLNQAIRKDLSHTTETSKKQITKELDNSSFVKNSKIKQHNKEGEIDELIKTDHSLDELVWKSRMREMPLHDQPEHNLTFMRTDGKLDFLYANQVLKKDIISTNKLQLNQSQKLDHGTNAKNQLRKTFTFEQIINNETTGVKLWDNDTAATFRESDGITSNQTSFNRTSTTETIINPQQAREESIDYDDYADDINSGGGDDSNYRNQHSANFGDFSNREWCPEEDPIQILRTANSQSKYYYIAAEELVWDYAAKQTTEASKHRQRQQSQGKTLGSKFKKAMFLQYKDNMFKHPVVRGEAEEHLGILGPVISAEVNDIIVVKFKNMASRPFSIHTHGVPREIPYEYKYEEEEVIDWPRKADDIVYPNKTKVYIWHVTKGSAPTDKDFDCRAWTYYSDVNPERDIHTGLIGPLIICRRGTLNKIYSGKLKIQEFSLLFMTFDENKSWYLEDNIKMFCKYPCHVRADDPAFQNNNKFHAINGHVAESLPGLVMAQNRLVRWYLINMGGSTDIYSVHFHGQPFIMRRSKEHRMGVYTLFPGSFGTIEMLPTKVGYWLVDCETAEHQQAGMRAIFLVYDAYCVVPLGLATGRIADSQLTASGQIGKWRPQLARLHNSGFTNAWRGKGSRPWIQVDLKSPMFVHGIITQGARHYFKHLYVDHFYIAYSLDTYAWRNYKSNSTLDIKIFIGNTDATGTVKNHFNPPIIARYIRVYPKPSTGQSALRMELLGCDLQSCSLPLGMESRVIADHQLSASSFWVSISAWTPSLARLNKEGFTNAWVPKRNNPHEWLQINFQHRKKITGIITQGASHLGRAMFVKEFIVSYSDNRNNWTVFKDRQTLKEKVFKGNVDSKDQVQNTFDPPIFAQYLRIFPKTWQQNIALRVEVLGCETEQRL